MAKHPNLNELDYLFEEGTDFQLTDRIYEEKTGVPLPKDKSYIKNRSALANRALEKGFIIADVKDTPIIERTIILKKKI